MPSQKNKVHILMQINFAQYMYLIKPQGKIIYNYNSISLI